MSVEVKASFIESLAFGAAFSESENMSADFEAVVVASDMPPYDGAYEVTPSAHEAQTLETAGKVMRDDVTVQIIPLFRTSNTSGETVYIASEV